MAEDIKVSEFIVNELSEEKLQELKDTNTVPPNEMFLTDEEGEQFTRGLSLGTIVVSTVELDDPYLQKADGRSLAQDGMYAEFCTWLKNRVLANSSNVPTCTIEEYATEMNTYLQCGKYVINDTSEAIRSGNYSVPANSIKLPTLVEFVASNNGGEEIGLAQLDMFKSHSHYALTVVNSANNGGGNIASGSTRSGTDYNTESTRIFNTGDEETRPKNIRYPYYIVVATATKTDVQIDLENVANDINSINQTLAKTDKIKVVYDAFSNDPNVNKGYTGGLLGDTWSPFYLSKGAKGCYVYAIRREGGLLVRFYIDLNIFNTPDPPSECTVTGLVKHQVALTTSHHMYRMFGVNVTINPFDNGYYFSVREFFEFSVLGGGYTQYQQDAYHYVYKVEEVY